MKKPNGFLNVLVSLTILLCICAVSANAQKKKVNMNEVREIVKMPVNEALKDTPVKVIEPGEYWKALRRKYDKPLIAFFYSDKDPESQRVASLLKYVALDYDGRIYFIRVETSNEGKPDKRIAEEFRKKFDLEKTPGILFYDNVRGKLVLEDEDYVDADFKEFRTPSLTFWQTYYSVVRKELDKLLSD